MRWLLRIAGIGLAVVSLLMLAHSAGVVRYEKLFLDWLQWLENIVVDIPLNEVARWVVHPVLEYLRGLGWPIPPLQDHWHHVFVLTWLVMNAAGRFLRPAASYPTGSGEIASGRNPDGGSNHRRLVSALPWVVAALILSLLASVAAGTKPMSSLALILFPIASYFVLFALGRLVDRGIGYIFLISAVPLVLVGFADNAPVDETQNVTPLAWLALVVLLFGLFLMRGYRNDGRFKYELENEYPNAVSTVERQKLGENIVTAILLALSIAVLAAEPPLL